MVIKDSTDKQSAIGEAFRPSVTFVAPDQLKLNPANPRRHDQAQIRALASGMKAFGFTAPVLVDRNGQVVAGEARLKASQRLGLSEIPVIRLEHLSDTQAKAYTLADNQLASRSRWDDKAVATQLVELCQIVDFDVELTGFERPEIDVRIQSAFDDDADYFEVSPEPPVSMPGELWSLGHHRLYCGDALDPIAYSALLGNQKATAVLTDPPYNVPIDGHVSGNGRVTHREFAMASGEMTVEEFTSFLTQSFEQMCAHTVAGALFYIFMDWRHQGAVLAAAASTNCDLLNLCVWVKENGRMGSFYRSQHELVYVLKSGKAAHINNIQLGRYGRNRTNVWRYPGAIGFRRNGRVNTLDLHPTVKPVALIADALLDSTNRGDIVLDPFAGAGSGILAAQQVGRRCCAIEIDAHYADTAIERWQRQTGEQATNPEGKTYAQVKRERGAAP